MRIKRRHRIISGINMIILVFNLLVPLVTPTPVYAKAPTKKEIKAAGGSMVVGKYVFWIDKNGKKRRRKGNTIPAGMQVYIDNHPEYYAQFIKTGTGKANCETAWCGAAGGFCAPAAMLNQGMGCNNIAEAAFGIKPCYETNTCARCAADECGENMWCNANGFCTPKSEVNTDADGNCINVDDSLCKDGKYFGMNEDGEIRVDDEWEAVTLERFGEARVEEKLVLAEALELVEPKDKEYSSEEIAANLCYKTGMNSSRCRMMIIETGLKMSEVKKLVDEKIMYDTAPDREEREYSDCINIDKKTRQTCREEAEARVVENEYDLVQQAAIEAELDSFDVNKIVNGYWKCLSDESTATNIPYCRSYIANATILLEEELVATVNAYINNINEDWQRQEIYKQVRKECYRFDEVNFHSGDSISRYRYRLDSCFKALNKVKDIEEVRDAEGKVVVEGKKADEIKVELLDDIREQKEAMQAIELCVQEYASDGSSDLCDEELAGVAAEFKAKVEEQIASVRREIDASNLADLALRSNSDLAASGYCYSFRGPVRDGPGGRYLSRWSSSEIAACRDRVMGDLTDLDPELAEEVQGVIDLNQAFVAIQLGDTEELKVHCAKYESGRGERRCSLSEDHDGWDDWYRDYSRYLINSSGRLEDEDKQAFLAMVDFQSEVAAFATEDRTIEETIKEQKKNQQYCDEYSYGYVYSIELDRCLSYTTDGEIADVRPVKASEEVTPNTFLFWTGCARPGWVMSDTYGGCVLTHPESAITGTTGVTFLGITFFNSCKEGYESKRSLLPGVGVTCRPAEGHGDNVFSQIWTDNVKVVASAITDGYLALQASMFDRDVRNCKDKENKAGFIDWDYYEAHDSVSYATSDMRDPYGNCLTNKMRAELKEIEDQQFYGEGADEGAWNRAYIDAVDMLVGDRVLTGEVRDYFTVDWKIREGINREDKEKIEAVAEDIVGMLSNRKKSGAGVQSAQEYATSYDNVVAYYQAVGDLEEGEMPANPFLYTTDYFYASDGEWYRTVDKFAEIGVRDFSKEAGVDWMSKPLQEVAFRTIFRTRRWLNRYVIAAEPAFEWREMTGDGRSSLSFVFETNLGRDFDLINESYADLEEFEQILFDESAKAVSGFIDQRAGNWWINAAMPIQTVIAVAGGFLGGWLGALATGGPGAVPIAVATETLLNSAVLTIYEKIMDTPQERLARGLKAAAKDEKNAEYKDELNAYAIKAGEIEHEQETKDFQTNLAFDVILGGIGEAFFWARGAKNIFETQARQLAFELAEDLEAGTLKRLLREGGDELISAGYLMGKLSDGRVIKITKEMMGKANWMDEFVAFRNVESTFDEAAVFIKGLDVGPGVSRWTKLKKITWSHESMIDQLDEAIQAKWGVEVAEDFINSKNIQNIVKPPRFSLRENLASRWEYEKQRWGGLRNSLVGGREVGTRLSLKVLEGAEVIVRQGDEVIVGGERVVLGEGLGDYVRVVDADGNIKFAGEILDETELVLKDGYKIQLSEGKVNWQGTGQLAESTIKNSFDEIDEVILAGAEVRGLLSRTTAGLERLNPFRREVDGYVTIGSVDEAVELGLEPGTRVRLTEGWSRNRVLVVGADGEMVLRKLTLGERLADNLGFLKLGESVDLATGKINWGEWLETRRFGKIASSTEDVVLLPGQKTVLRVGDKPYVIDSKVTYIRIFDNQGKILHAIPNQAYESIPIEYLQKGNWIELGEGNFDAITKSGSLARPAGKKIAEDGVRVKLGVDRAQVRAAASRVPEQNQFGRLGGYAEELREAGESLKVVEDVRAGNRIRWLEERFQRVRWLIV